MSVDSDGSMEIEGDTGVDLPLDLRLCATEQLLEIGVDAAFDVGHDVELGGEPQRKTGRRRDDVLSVDHLCGVGVGHLLAVHELVHVSDGIECCQGGEDLLGALPVSVAAFLAQELHGEGHLRLGGEVTGGVELLLHGRQLVDVQSGRMDPALGTQALQDLVHFVLLVDSARSEQRLDVALKSFHPSFHLSNPSLFTFTFIISYYYYSIYYFNALKLP